MIKACKKIKEKKGITLIALVVTIIVLLILVGISISLVLGENGVITRAKTASQIDKQAAAKERVEMKIAEIEMIYAQYNRSATWQEIVEAFQNDPNFVIVDYETASLTPVEISQEDIANLNNITVVNMQYPEVEVTLENTNKGAVARLTRIKSETSKNYTITYNANGGTGTMTPTKGTNPQVANNEFTAQLGYEFAGWKDENGTLYSVGETINRDLTLNAQWKLANGWIYMTVSGNGSQKLFGNYFESIPTQIYVNGEETELNNGTISTRSGEINQVLIYYDYKLESLNAMFEYVDTLLSIDLRGLDTSDVTDMGYLFYGCTNLSNVNINGIDTSKVTHMNAMFAFCSNLTDLDLSELDTSKVGNMNIMFYKCSGLRNLKLWNSICKNVNTCNAMFEDATSNLIIRVPNNYTSLYSSTLLSNLEENIEYYFYATVETY